MSDKQQTVCPFGTACRFNKANECKHAIH